jgi:SAM-dependent methyltransferase
MTDLERQFGRIDIYLLDQLLRGRLLPSMRILDAGCGSGRNLVYLLSAGYEVFAVDADPEAIAAVRRMAAALAPQLPATNLREEPVHRMSFPNAFVDVVISSAVLHFASDDRAFEGMMREMWRVLRPGGLFFARLASDIGMASRMQPIAGRRFLLPDGTERYLVNEAMLIDLTKRLGGVLIDPLKTSLVQDQRCMTTWVVRKTGAG